MIGPYDPDVETYLALVRNAARPAFETLTVKEARAFYRAGRDTLNLPSIDVGPVNDLWIEGRGGPIRLRHYQPDAAQDVGGGAILFFHGGGWVIGDLDTHDGICRHLVKLTGLPLVAVDYRLAPEHPFPAAVEDAMDTHGWMIANADRVGFSPDRLLLAGDSAGGCLALVAGLCASDLGRPKPLGQLLFYPVADIKGCSPSYRDVAGVPMTASTMRWFIEHYLSDPEHADDWRASPLHAPSLAGIAPTFLVVAGQDPLRDEGLALSDRLRDTGCELTLRYLPGQVHGYLTVGRIIAEAQRTLRAAAAFIADRIEQLA